MRLGPWVYAGAFGVALALALIFTPVALRIALRKGALDHPGSYKTQASPIPYLGGLAIVLSFSVAVLAASLVGPTGRARVEIAGILFLATVLSLLGLLDDIRGVHPAVRFGIETAAAAILFSGGVQVNLFQTPWIDGAITILWIVGIANAFNLLDNMDGLSAGVAAIASAFFFIIALVNQQFLVAALAAGLTGCAVGFLRHNFHPARIYMGDAGSLFLGFLLAVIAIKLRFEASAAVAFMTPVLVLGVPIIDTALVTVSRLTHGKNPFMGGRDHVSHRLVFIGIPVRAAVWLIYAGAVGFGWIGLVMSRVDLLTGYILMGLVVAMATFGTVLLYLVPVYENSKQRRMMTLQARAHEPEEVLTSSDL